GPSYSVPAIADALAGQGADVTVRTLGPCDDRAFRSGARCVEHQCDRDAIGRLLRSSKELRLALTADALDGAILHAHGLWLMPNVYPAWARRRAGGRARLVHSTRGMLAPASLRLSSWKKIPHWFAFQRRALKMADCIHATAISEYQ